MLKLGSVWTVTSMPPGNKMFKLFHKDLIRKPTKRKVAPLDQKEKCRPQNHDVAECSKQPPSSKPSSAAMS